MRKVLGALTVRERLAAVAFLSALGSIISFSEYRERVTHARLAESNIPIYATVLEEHRSQALAPVEQYGGFASFSNETVRLSSAYTLLVERQNGDTISVHVLDSGPHGTATAQSLDALVQAGSMIKFPQGNQLEPTRISMSDRYETDEEETWIDDDTQQAAKRAHRIRLVR